MDYPLFTKLAAEFFGTAILMIFGNGSVANVELKNTKGHHAGWLNIAMGYGSASCSRCSCSVASPARTSTRP